jgi:hypothetical protein
MIAESNDEATDTSTATPSTEMYIAAEKDDWQAVVLRLKTHPQEACIFNDEHSVTPSSSSCHVARCSNRSIGTVD